MVHTSHELIREQIKRHNLETMDADQLRVGYYLTGSKAVLRMFHTRFPKQLITLTYADKDRLNLIRSNYKITAMDRLRAIEQAPRRRRFLAH